MTANAAGGAGVEFKKKVYSDGFYFLRNRVEKGSLQDSGRDLNRIKINPDDKTMSDRQVSLGSCC